MRTKQALRILVLATMAIVIKMDFSYGLNKGDDPNLFHEDSEQALAAVGNADPTNVAEQKATGEFKGLCCTKSVSSTRDIFNKIDPPNSLQQNTQPNSGAPLDK